MHYCFDIYIGSPESRASWDDGQICFPGSSKPRVSPWARWLYLGTAALWGQLGSVDAFLQQQQVASGSVRWPLCSVNLPTRVTPRHLFPYMNNSGLALMFSELNSHEALLRKHHWLSCLCLSLLFLFFFHMSKKHSLLQNLDLGASAWVWHTKQMNSFQLIDHVLSSQWSAGSFTHEKVCQSWQEAVSQVGKTPVMKWSIEKAYFPAA